MTVSEGLSPEQYWFLKAPGSRQPSSGLGCQPPYQGPRGPQCPLSVRNQTTPSDRRLSLPLGRAATTAGLWCDPSWGFKTGPWSPQATRQEHGSGPDTPKQWGWAIPKPFRPLSACTAETSQHTALPRGHFSSWGPSPHPDNDQASYLASRHLGNECELAPTCRCPPARAGLRNSGPKVVDTLGPLTEQFLPKAHRTYAEVVAQTGEELAVAACPERGSHSILLQASQRLPMAEGCPRKAALQKCTAHPQEPCVSGLQGAKNREEPSRRPWDPFLPDMCRCSGLRAKYWPIPCNEEREFEGHRTAISLPQAPGSTRLGAASPARSHRVQTHKSSTPESKERLHVAYPGRQAGVLDGCRGRRRRGGRH
ncbi:uncharacterized protein LOC117093431 [Trachypithecus francoisi]|uniref:uncharacterized protein LOC117093431 n=1 Tax=Trachypithecus francoisi TaxID=54180 RepID=UPI00141AD3B9|nr:uncharacterized protein LOC117093431 [Trachypithecus francoisi]